MSENKLREAYSLMKQGDKKGASLLVQEVLREDKMNSKAWWLFAHVLEDEAKIVKSLERVLALEPEHLGARKKLSEMRPEYAHLYQKAQSSEKNKPVSPQDAPDYWDKLKRPATHTIKRDGGIAGMLLRGLGWRIGIRLIALVIVLVIGAIYGIFSAINTQLTLADSLGQTPQDVTKSYIEAIYRQDITALYELSCVEHHPTVESYFDGSWDEDLGETRIDSSQTSYSLHDYSNQNNAYVTLHGIVSVEYQGTTLTIDLDENAISEGFDFYGEFLRRENGIWKICVEYHVPNLRQVDDN